MEVLLLSHHQHHPNYFLLLFFSTPCLDSIVFKDLGMQIAWTTVFVIEYFIPMLAFPLIFLLRSFIYSEQAPLSSLQWLAFLCFVLHFVKRELETLFVHKFSKGTMPVFNLFKNSSYYWGFAFVVAYFVLHPRNATFENSLANIGLIVFIVCCHIFLFFIVLKHF